MSAVLSFTVIKHDLHNSGKICTTMQYLDVL